MRANRFFTALALVAALGLMSCGDGNSVTGVFFTPQGEVAGVLYFSQDSNGNGLYVVNTTTGAATLAGAGISGTTSSTIGLTGNASDDSLFGSIFSDIHTIAADGSNSTFLNGRSAEGLGFHTGNGLIYWVINTSFGSLDPNTGAVATLASAPFDVEGLAGNAAANVIYGIGDGNNLVVYDVATNTWSTIGDTGMNWDSGGLAYDSVNNILFAVAEAQGDNLYTIDPATAQAALVGPMGLGQNARGGLGMTGGG